MNRPFFWGGCYKNIFANGTISTFTIETQTHRYTYDTHTQTKPIKPFFLEQPENEWIPENTNLRYYLCILANSLSFQILCFGPSLLLISLASSFDLCFFWTLFLFTHSEPSLCSYLAFTVALNPYNPPSTPRLLKQSGLLRASLYEHTVRTAPLKFCNMGTLEV